MVMNVESIDVCAAQRRQAAGDTRDEMRAAADAADQALYRRRSDRQRAAENGAFSKRAVRRAAMPIDNRPPPSADTRVTIACASIPFQARVNLGLSLRKQPVYWMNHQVFQTTLSSDVIVARSVVPSYLEVCHGEFVQQCD